VRARLENISRRRGVEFLHKMVSRVDPASAKRILPRDQKRLVRCLEVYFLTGRPLTDHFADTVSPLRGHTTVAVGLSVPLQEIAARTARRVDQQFERGLLDEIRGLLARGVPETARPFGGLVYRQALEHLHGMRGDRETRALIAQENRRYARRQLIWFRKEPNLVWLEASGEQPDAAAAVESILAKWPNFPESS
jgi:tRNA dimethylallyltransferase